MDKQKYDNKVKNVKYGILGGTFDPIHNGHLFIAQTVLEEFKLDRILFIPNRISPHKLDVQVTLPYHRVAMAEIGTINNRNFNVSSLELNRSGPSYTIDTIRALIQENHNDITFYFITGTDVFIDLETWKNYNELLKLLNFVIVTRKGYNDQALDEKIEYFTREYDGKISKLVIPTLEISSTDIRNRIKRGKYIKYLVPEGVENYIYKHRLYTE